MTYHYFAYGSNLPSRRIKKRIPEAQFYQVATLQGYKLAWHKISRNRNGERESGKCDIAVTGDHKDIVYGVVYVIPQVDRKTLDKYEGSGYSSKHIKVTTRSGDQLEALTYFAKDNCIDNTLKPFHWYKKHVLRGAREHNFPADYIAMIEAQESICDNDEERVVRELTIYQN